MPVPASMMLSGGVAIHILFLVIGSQISMANNSAVGWRNGFRFGKFRPIEMIKNQRPANKFRLSKGYRRLIRFVCSRLYRDNSRDMSRSVLVAGTARSGTTWLADILASQIPSRMMFEPFHPILVEEYSQFNYYQYLRAGAENQALYSYALRVFSGDIRNPWIDRQVEHISFQKRIVKAVRANLIMKWLHEKFPVVPQIFILRHPCAVVASRLQLNWATDSDIEPFLSQTELVEDFLGDYLGIIKSANTDEEKHAIIWSISNLVPIKQFGFHKFNIVFYEDMCINPEIEIPRVFKIADIDYKPTVFEKVERPSTTSRQSSAILNGKNRISNWETVLSTRQVNNILRVVKDFGLDYIYGDSFMPLVTKL